MPETPQDPSEATRAELARVTAEAVALSAEVAAQTTGTDLVPTGGQDAVAVKARMAASRAALARKQAEANTLATRLKAEVQAKVDAMTADLRRQEAEVSAMLAPLMEQVKMLQEGIWTVNLYLGTEEQLVLLHDGEPAPEGTPITVRQGVLFMDEESAIAAETGGIDARNVDEFDEWLKADPAHVAQVAPEVRGVVAIKPRRKGTRDYGDPGTQRFMDEANDVTYFLIRNGQRLYRMTTAFDVGLSLVPRSGEFTRLFERKRYNWETRQEETYAIEPGTDEWLKAEKTAGAVERHYMRVALILQGLIDRTPVFHPLPAPTVSLLSMAAYNEGHVRLLANEENLLTDGREPFYDWLARLNATLRPGMRIIGAFDGEEWRNARRGDDDYGSDRLHPRHAVKPQSLVLHTLTSKTDDGGFRFAYDRIGDTTTETYRDYDHPKGNGWYYERTRQVPVKRRGSCLIYPGDRFVIPFDLVSVAEMERYLNSRVDRHAYATSFPLLKAAIAAKRAEAEQEKPFRDLLTATLTQTDGLDLDTEQAAALVDEFVQWWKTGNRWHRPLNGDPEAEGKALRMIVREAVKRATANTSGDESASVALIRQQHSNVVAIARKPDGTWVTYSSVPRRYDLPANVFVHAHEGKRAAALNTREWVLPSPAFGRWRLLWQADEWRDWDRAATLAKHLTDPEVDLLVEEAKARLTARCMPAAVSLHNGGDYYDRSVWVEGYGYSPEPVEVSDTPFTTEQRMIEVPVETVRWERVKGGGFEIKPRNRDVRTRHEVDRTKQWSTWRAEDYLSFVKGIVVWSDPKVCALADAEHAAIVAERGRGAAIERHAERLWSSLDPQMVAEWTAEHRAKYDADFGEPDLWEGHLKSLGHPPHVTRYSRSFARSRFNDKADEVEAIAALIEKGVEVEGMTLDDALALFVQMTGEEVRRTSQPREIGHLILTARPEPEDEDDDEPEDEPEPEPEPEAAPEPTITVIDSDGRVIEGVIE
jgi:hypothetical protein